MRQLGILSLIVCLAAASGCSICCWGKRATELGSPTDIRKAHFWCLGEDAIFEQPCGPSKEDYGLKPTCWREWPADGGRCRPGSCPDGSCGPGMAPGFPVERMAPPNWEGPVPQELGPGLNPFQDDTPTLPSPAGGGARFEGTKSSAKAVTANRTKDGPTLLPGAVSSQGVRNEHRPPAPAAPKVPMRPTVTPKAAALPATLPARTGAPRQASAAKEPPLKITVSEPIDTPARYLAPVESPRTAGHSEVSPARRPVVEAATLASLEQMMEVPTASAAGTPGPLVVRNDFAPEPKPFRLATRTTLERPAHDPALEKKTLSALETMMSNDTPSGPVHPPGK